MPNTREKLIELLEGVTQKMDCPQMWEIADHLIANGVTVADKLSATDDNLSAIDVVPVVRCKDCKSWEQYNACDGTKPYRCMNHDAIFYKRTNPDDFCSCGERKDNDS